MKSTMFQIDVSVGRKKRGQKQAERLPNGYDPTGGGWRAGWLVVAREGPEGQLWPG